MNLPQKGVDVIAITKEGDKMNVFRCNCKNEDCKEWRCSITGLHCMIDVVEWEELKNKVT